MRRARNLFGVAATAAALVATVTACDPVPRLHLTVDSTAAGADASPGDGVCSSPAAGGACTLQAAIEEANASASGADVDIPAGTYPGGATTITGDVKLSGAAPASVVLGPAHFTVAAGAQLTANRIGAVGEDFEASTVMFTVDGNLVLNQADIGGLTGTAITVRSGGSAWVADSRMFGVGSGSTSGAVDNAGTFYGIRTSMSTGGRWGNAIQTAPGATTHLAASYVGPLIDSSLTSGGCTGERPISHGYVHTTSLVAPCTLVGSGTDSAGPTGSGASSVLVDAVPLGSPWCEPGAADPFGNPRGNDGNGDGVAGCDIGGFEYTP